MIGTAGDGRKDPHLVTVGDGIVKRSLLAVDKDLDVGADSAEFVRDPPGCRGMSTLEVPDDLPYVGSGKGQGRPTGQIAQLRREMNGRHATRLPSAPRMRPPDLSRLVHDPRAA